jgi:hypothetical protein
MRYTWLASPCLTLCISQGTVAFIHSIINKAPQNQTVYIHSIRCSHKTWHFCHHNTLLFYLLK